MKLTVFGPTGATGEQIRRRALAVGHDVTAVARRPDAVTVIDPRLRVFPATSWAQRRPFAMVLSGPTSCSRRSAAKQ